MESTTLAQTEATPPLANFASAGKALWHDSAPKTVRQTCRPGEDGAGWKAWGKYLAGRKLAAGLKKWFARKPSPLLWALPDDVDTAARARIERFVAFAQKAAPADAARELADWHRDVADGTPNIGWAVQCVAVAQALPRLADRVEATLWWSVLDYLVDVATSAPLDPKTQPVTAQIAAGELPRTLAVLLPELKVCRKLGDAGGRNLTDGLVDLLDGEGLLHSDHLQYMRTLLACWTRSIAVDKCGRRRLIGATARDQYEWLVRNSLRFARADGSLAFSYDEAGKWNAELFAAALELSGDKEDLAAARLCLPGGKSKSKKVDSALLPEPANNSEWSGLAVLRPDWKRRGHRLFARFADSQFELELQLGKHQALAGLWQCEVQIDGAVCRVESPWEELCWMTDDDVDYLEVEATLSGGARLQRQLVMAREDGFLLLCDNVLTGSAQQIEYRGRLPLSDDVVWSEAEESREAELLAGDSGKPVARVLPLALPEWRADPRGGNLTTVAGNIELIQDIEGSNLCCPMFFDLQSSRLKKPFTWRRLTVAEALEIQPPSVAAGYRVQCGRDQWLFYRSLAKPANRTLLGQNISCEYLAARFTRDGEAEPLIEIE